MCPLWKSGSTRPTRHGDPDEAVARYLEQLHQADVAGAPAPPAALNGLGDAYLDKDDSQAAADYWRQAAEAYAREGMHASAVACLKKIRRHVPDEGDLAIHLSRAYSARGLTADALGELDRYVDRRGRAGGRRETIEALSEIVRLAPERAERHEELAALLLEDGQRVEAVAAMRSALSAYSERGETESVRRVTAQLDEVEGRPADVPPAAAGPGAAPPSAAPPPPVAPPPTSSAPPEEPPDPLARGPLDEEFETDGPPEEEAVDPFSGLEIERTSYGLEGPVEPPEEPLTVEQESMPDDVSPAELELELELDDLSAAASLRDAMAELESSAAEPPAAEPPAEEPPAEEPPAEEPPAEEPPDPEEPPAPPPAILDEPPPADFAELADLARRQAQAGDREQAARNLLVAAEGLRGEDRWPEAVRAYRSLAEIGEAKDEDFDDWVECARQTGRASEVLEALAVGARTRLARGDRAGARTAAEEMLLVDPYNAVASEILERVGSALPPE